MILCRMSIEHVSARDCYDLSFRMSVELVSSRVCYDLCFRTSIELVSARVCYDLCFRTSIERRTLCRPCDLFSLFPKPLCLCLSPYLLSPMERERKDH